MQEEIRTLEKSGRIRDVTHLKDDPSEVVFKLPIFAIQQGSKFRTVWDARRLNQYVKLESFTMESIVTAAKVVRPGDWLVTIDMFSGYHQLELKPDFRKYCCFEFDHKVYEWQVLPFGLK
jgi:hypothetical protein